MSEEERKVKYLVTTRGQGEFVIEIPASWRVTFGYVNPAGAKESYNRGDAHCLRIWEDKMLRAVYGDVTGFRDLSIPMARKVTRDTGSSQWTQDSMGNFEESVKRERLEAWLQPGDDQEVLSGPETVEFLVP